MHIRTHRVSYYPNTQQRGSALDPASPRSCKGNGQAAQQEACESAPQPFFSTRPSCARISTHRKNATRESERSSPTERDDEKIERRTAGDTGMRLRLGEGGWGGEPAEEGRTLAPPS